MMKKLNLKYFNEKFWKFEELKKKEISIKNHAIRNIKELGSNEFWDQFRIWKYFI